MNTDKLISLVRQRRGLWDREHPEHRSQYALNELWQQVAQELKCTNDEVKFKWQSLRKSFSKTQRRMQMRGCSVDDRKVSDYKLWIQFKRLSFLKKQCKSSATRADISPKEKKTSEDDQPDTRDEKLEGSKIMKFGGAPADILDVKTEACGPLSSNEQQAALCIESHKTKHSSRRSYQRDVNSASTQTERPMLRVSEDEHKARDQDDIFFESLIPVIKGFSSARKMLLRIKIQELIYHFVYNEKHQTRQ
jgi:hypothetical protein